jgi:hypothetical protein
MVNFEDSFVGLGLPTDEDLFLPSGDSDHEEDKGNRAGQRLRPKRIPRKSVEKRKQDDMALDAMTGMKPSIIRGRWIVILVLCACATGTALATFQFISRNENDEFRNTVSQLSLEHRHSNIFVSFILPRLHPKILGSVSGKGACGISGRRRLADFGVATQCCDVYYVSRAGSR